MAEAQDLSHFVRRPADGVAAMDLVVDGVYCGACIVTIEKGLRKEAGVRGARVNLASRRVTVEWNEGALDPPVILERLEALGYPAYPFAAGDRRQRRDPGGKAAPALPRRRRLRRDERHAAVGLAVGGRGQRSRTPRRATSSTGCRRWSRCRRRPMPAMPFFESAAKALRARSVNMDVPISLGVMLALGMSMLQTLAHQRVAYFDSALMLLMFLLAGRYLDQRMRRRTRDFAVNLSAIRADRAVKLFDDGEARETPIAAIEPGDLVLVRAGERIAVDGDGRGRTLGDRPEPRDRRDGAGRRSSPGAPVYAGDRQPERRAARPRAERGERNLPRRGQRPAGRAPSSSARPTSASPTARRSSMCRSST